MSLAWSDMKQMVRDRIGDDPAAPATPFYADAYLYRLIYERLKACQGMLKRLAPNYWLSEGSMASVASQSDYHFTTDFSPAVNDFGHFVKLERKYGTGATAWYQEVQIRSAEHQADPGSPTFRPILALPDTISRQWKTVSIWKDFIRIDPIPQDASENYRLKYLRRVNNYVLVSDAVDFPEEWLTYVALDCAVFVLKRKGDGRVKMLEDERAEELKVLRKHFRRNRMQVEGFGPLEAM